MLLCSVVLVSALCPMFTYRLYARDCFIFVVFSCLAFAVLQVFNYRCVCVCVLCGVCVCAGSALCACHRYVCNCVCVCLLKSTPQYSPVCLTIVFVLWLLALSSWNILVCVGLLASALPQRLWNETRTLRRLLGNGVFQFCPYLHAPISVCNFTGIYRVRGHACSLQNAGYSQYTRGAWAKWPTFVLGFQCPTPPYTYYHLTTYHITPTTTPTYFRHLSDNRPNVLCIYIHKKI